MCLQHCSPGSGSRRRRRRRRRAAQSQDKEQDESGLRLDPGTHKQPPAPWKQGQLTPPTPPEPDIGRQSYSLTGASPRHRAPLSVDTSVRRLLREHPSALCLPSRSSATYRRGGPTSQTAPPPSPVRAIYGHPRVGCQLFLDTHRARAPTEAEEAPSTSTLGRLSPLVLRFLEPRRCLCNEHFLRVSVTAREPGDSANNGHRPAHPPSQSAGSGLFFTRCQRGSTVDPEVPPAVLVSGADDTSPPFFL